MDFKQEPKQHAQHINNNIEEFDKAIELSKEIKLETIFNDEKKKGVKELIDKHKQETLEEVAERILANNIDGLKDTLQDDDLFFFYKRVVLCYGEAMAEWRQEQDKKLYSYDEALQILHNIFAVYGKHIDVKFNENLINDMFSQYKK